MTFPRAQHLADLDCADEHDDNPGRGGEQGGARGALRLPRLRGFVQQNVEADENLAALDFRSLTLIRWAA